MSDTELVDVLLTLLVAGHETTAKALAWTLYLLARSPKWERRMLDEVRRVAGDAPIEREHLDGLKVTSMVLKESMRVYPPVPTLTRIAKVDTELGGTKVAAGSLIFIPIYAVHRHRRLWEDPDRFDPERFAPERESGYSRYQYFPFGLPSDLHRQFVRYDRVDRHAGGLREGGVLRSAGRISPVAGLAGDVVVRQRHAPQGVYAQRLSTTCPQQTPPDTAKYPA
jgi:cytochrome P450